jgi:5'-nucleotidase
MKLWGRAVDPRAKYRVAFNDFTAQGGDGFDVARQGTDLALVGNDLDALLEYLRSHPNTKPGRSRIVRN